MAIHHFNSFIHALVSLSLCVYFFSIVFILLFFVVVFVLFSEFKSSQKSKHIHKSKEHQFQCIYSCSACIIKKSSITFRQSACYYGCWKARCVLAIYLGAPRIEFKPNQYTIEIQSAKENNDWQNEHAHNQKIRTIRVLAVENEKLIMRCKSWKQFQSNPMNQINCRADKKIYVKIKHKTNCWATNEKWTMNSVIKQKSCQNQMLTKCA